MATACASAGSSSYVGERRLGSGRALADELEAGPGDAAACRTDDPVGEGHHLRRGTVVAFEPDHGGVRESAGEVEQILRGGTGERVDRLIRVADDGEVVAVAEPRVEHALLQGRDVLVLVDDEAAVTVAELLGDGGVLLERGGRVQQQVVEVEEDTVVAHLEGLVAGVDGSHPSGVGGGLTPGPGHRGRVVLRRDERTLGPLDLREQVAHGVGVGGEPGTVRGLGDDGELAVEQLPRRVADHSRPEVAQLPQRGGVEGTRLHLRPRAAHPEFAQPAAHLPGGAGGERDGEDLAGRDVSVGHQVRDAAGDGPGLSRPGTGEDTHRAPRREDRRRLLGIQALHRCICSHGLHHGRTR